MRRRSGGLISDRLSRAWECAKAQKKKKKRERRTESEQTQWDSDGEWGVRRSHFCISVGYAKSPADHHGGPRETLRRGGVRAPPFGTIARVWCSNAAGSPEYHARWCDLLVVSVTEAAPLSWNYAS